MVINFVSFAGDEEIINIDSPFDSFIEGIDISCRCGQGYQLSTNELSKVLMCIEGDDEEGNDLIESLNEWLYTNFKGAACHKRDCMSCAYMHTCSITFTSGVKR